MAQNQRGVSANAGQIDRGMAGRSEESHSAVGFLEKERSRCARKRGADQNHHNELAN